MKGLVFVDDYETGMRFAVASAFRELASRHELVIVNVRTTSGTNRVQGRFAEDGLRTLEFQQFEGRFARWQELFDISCIRYRNLSPSFEERCRDFAETDPKRYARLARSADPAAYDRHRSDVERDMGLHPEMLRITLAERPDFFVIPSALLDRHTDDALQIAREFRVPAAVLVAGWDNASSKGLLYHQPSVVGVWGEQSKAHVVEIQKVPAHRVHVIGAPHYESFREPLADAPDVIRARWGLPAESPIVLFAGTFRTFDETALLLELDDLIEAGEFPHVHVLYRPHPWRLPRQGEASFFDCRWRHVTLDPTMSASYKTRGLTSAAPSSATNFLDRMTHLRELYRLANAVVTPMSSVLLESMIAGLPVMAIAFGDGRHSWSADRVSRMLHFRELYDIDEVTVVRERAGFFPALKQLLTKVGDAEHAAKLQASARFFHAQDAEPYSIKGADLVDRMLAREPAPRYEGSSARAGKTYVAETWLKNSALYRTARRALRRLGIIATTLRIGVT